MLRILKTGIFFAVLGMVTAVYGQALPPASAGPPSPGAGTGSSCECGMEINQLRCQMVADTNYLACLKDADTSAAEAACKHDFHGAESRCNPPSTGSVPATPASTPPPRR